MRAVIQRVTRAGVAVGGAVKSQIGAGLLVLLGVAEDDSAEDAQWLSGKIVHLRIFNDAEGVMNVSLKDRGGELLVVSQFTLHASTKKGNRPSYMRAAGSAKAIPLYEEVVRQLEAALGRPVRTGVFGADMQVELVNDGPVTILIDTQDKE